MKKSLQIMLLAITLNMSLLAGEVDELSNVLWQGTFVNSCTENFTFNPHTNIFTYISSFGKKMIGYYTLSNVRNSERFKVTFTVRVDNRLKDYFSSKYNVTNQTIVKYLWLEKNGKVLNMSDQKEGMVFNTYTHVETYTSTSLTLLQTMVAELAVTEIQQVQVNSNTQSIQQQVLEMQRKQNEESVALNKNSQSRLL